MKRIHIKFVKWLFNKLGYKIAMIKATTGTIRIEGDVELLRYIDIVGYTFKKEPLSRPKPIVSNKKSKIEKLTQEQLKDLGITK